MSQLYRVHLRALSWVSSAGGQQDRAQMVMYKGNSSSSTSAVFPLDPAVNEIGETIALRMRHLKKTRFPPKTPGPSTGQHHLRRGWWTLCSPFPWEWLTLFFHFPCLVNEAGEALGFKKTKVSAKGEKASLWGGRALEKFTAAEPGGVSQAAWVRMICGTLVLARGRVCKTGKTKIARSWATADLCQGRELDYKPCFFRSGGEGRKTNKKISPRGCSEAPQFGPQNACVCKLKDLTLKLLSGGGGGSGGGACMCVETETRWQLCLLLCWSVLNSTMYSSLKTRCKVLSG